MAELRSPAAAAAAPAPAPRPIDASFARAEPVPLRGAALGLAGRRLAAACAVVLLLAAVGTKAAADSPPAAPGTGTPRHSALTRGSVTGWKLPRFASLEADVVNLRRGPGTRYPIDWVYHRRGLPVEIIREFDTWRQIRMPDGTSGWVYHALLTGLRGFLVTAPNTILRRAPRTDATAVAHLRRGVVGRVRHCDAGAAWCAVQVQHLRGWLPRTVFYGTYPNEAVAAR